MEAMGKSHSHQRPKRNKTTNSQTQIPTTSTKSSNTKPVTLPPEIISEILSRLPVKPLSRFRCVSKEWCSLISSSEFVKSHIKISASREDYAHHQILTTFRGLPRSLNQCSLQSLMSERVTDSWEVDYPMKNSPHRSISLVGSCHGLLCITIDLEDMFIWNPAIQKFKKVPNLGLLFKFKKVPNPGSISFCKSIYGFGYDELNDDYKVIGVFSSLCESEFLSPNSCKSESKVFVYSLKLDCWRKIEGLKGWVFENDAGNYVKGKIHWQVGHCCWEIVSLDLDSEAYGKVDHPNYGEKKSKLTLGVVCDNLCVLSQYDLGVMDLWVMREYGVNESWTKILISPFHVFDPNDKQYTSPFCIAKNGEVVLVFGTKIVVYDPNKSFVLRYPVITNIDDIAETRVYVESLVSPVVNSEAGMEQKMKKAMD